MYKTNTSGSTGVMKKGNKWIGRWMENGKRRHRYFSNTCRSDAEAKKLAEKAREEGVQKNGGNIGKRKFNIPDSMKDEEATAQTYTGIDYIWHDKKRSVFVVINYCDLQQKNRRKNFNYTNKKEEVVLKEAIRFHELHPYDKSKGVFQGDNKRRCRDKKEQKRMNE